MKSLFRIFAIGGIMAASFAASAQNTNTGYFLDNYTYRYQLNPAFGLDRSFFSVPGLGNLNIAMRGNLHVSSLLYNVDGRTALFTNPKISAREVLDNFADKNRLGVNVRENILSIGFKGFHGYNTISINARANVNAIIPKSFISLAKEGLQNKRYEIKDLAARAMGYAEVALNHSHDIKAVPGLRIGASVKVLVGVANADLYFNEAHLTLGEDDWIAQTNAEIYANVPKFQFEHSLNKEGQEYVSGANLDGNGGFKPNGFGLAFDAGASYQWKDLSFSFALLDMGFINFKDTQYATTDGTRTVNTDAFHFNADGDAQNSFSNEWDRLRDDLESLYQLTDKGNIGSHSASLGVTMNIGVDYALPVYRKLHFGLLSSTRFQGKYTWTEARLSANINPVKQFSAGINVVTGTYGLGFGWMLNYHATGFNIFLGMDQMPGKLAKQGVPLNSNAAFNFGINFPLK